ncbi:hypothetical protein [Isoptericola dokdonensis]|jgi:sulfite exporter TauE/SafE|uniref:Uncharacterized protein n=1 Tax=Isoptericola dokdonensis DS-3 TaxID=1300344 RepID=A0A161I386_9MICO|nr:hypothetical protein [Isoptericola dokdonensis]ANC32395.1 hypothetical protein I598_2877 [Isoptericola dokdonensis DS-3]
MTATVVGAILLAIGLIWSVGEPGVDTAVLFIVPGTVIFVVGLILNSSAGTRQELARIRVELEALNRAGTQPGE